MTKIAEIGCKPDSGPSTLEKIIDVLCWDHNVYTKTIFVMTGNCSRLLHEIKSILRHFSELFHIKM